MADPVDIDISEVTYTKAQIDQQHVDSATERDTLLNAKVSTQSLGSPTGAATLDANGQVPAVELNFADITEIDDVTNETTLVNPKRLHYIITRDALKASTVGEANGLAPLDATSKVDPIYLPAVQYINTFVVTTLQNMYDLVSNGNVVNAGDRCVVTAEPTFDVIEGDYNGEYVANVVNPTTSVGWDQLPNLSAVQSVNGATGAVNITSIIESAANASRLDAIDALTPQISTNSDAIAANLVLINENISVAATQLDLIQTNETAISVNASAIQTNNTGINTLSDGVEGNTALIQVRAPFIPIYEFNTVTNTTISSSTYQPINSLVLSSAGTGTYVISLGMIYSYDQLNKSSYFRFSVDGGVSWTEIRKEPKDNSDKVPLSYFIPIEHISGEINVQVEAHKEDGTGTMVVSSNTISIERKS